VSHGKDAHSPSSNTNIMIESKLIERTIARREEILLKAETDANSIISAAEKQSERIVKEADSEVIIVLTSVLKGVRERIVGAADIEGRKNLMIARDNILASIYAEATEQVKVEYNNKEKHHKMLVNLISEACTSIGGTDFIVSCNEVDHAVLKRSHKKIVEEVSAKVGLPVTLEISDEHIVAAGGVVVQNNDQSKIYFNTVDSRIETAKAKLDAKLAKDLEA
jgi:vacuolar-type H+-ATPase subunit E/Vma4